MAAYPGIGRGRPETGNRTAEGTGDNQETMNRTGLTTLRGQPHLVALEQLTDPNVLATARAVVDSLLTRLLALPPDVDQDVVVQEFRKTVEELNAVSREGTLLLTDEREAICPLLNHIAELCELLPYSDQAPRHEWIDEWITF